jgi:U3 small nucleolar RNA-associated protein 19
VAALSALMEASRHEAGPATFSAPLYASTLTAALTSPTTAPEVFAALFQRYLAAADVRLTTLRVVTRLAAQAAVRGSPGSEAAVPEESEEEDLEQAEGNTDSAAAAAAAAQDVARNLFDVLAALPPQVAAGEEGKLTSWCGAAEVRGVQQPLLHAHASVTGPQRPLATLGQLQYITSTAITLSRCCVLCMAGCNGC